VYVHICGTDLIRDANGQFLVLEDNGRTPSGVSYVLENRAVMKKVFPHLFADIRVKRVEDYPHRLRDALASVAPPAGSRSPCVVVLSPGQFNSAYFEHCFLARHMGVELVFGPDLFVHDDVVYLKTTRGPQRVDVIYRRLTTTSSTPRRSGRTACSGCRDCSARTAPATWTLANAVGTGVADDKAVYPYVEDMIRFYLEEGANPAERADVHLRRPDDLAYSLDHLDELVVKAVNESGGYGMLMGPFQHGRPTGRVRPEDPGQTRATTSPSRS